MTDVLMNPGGGKPQAAITDAVSIAYADGDSDMYFRIPKGEYMKKAVSGYPEIRSGKSSVITALGGSTMGAVLQRLLVVSAGTGSGTVDIKSKLPDIYLSLSTENFSFISVSGTATGGGYSCHGSGACSLSYNASTGILTYNIPSYSGQFTSGVDGDRTVYGSIGAAIVCYYIA